MSLHGSCSLLIASRGSSPSSTDILKRLQSTKVASKTSAMEDLLIGLLNGETYGGLLTSVIRYIANQDDHRLKRLSQLYWEVVEKTTDDGDLKQEMILVCNALRNDLMSPNEYVRGTTLRLVSKLVQFKELVEPLAEVIETNVEHKSPYVRRAAIACIHESVKFYGDSMMPNATEMVFQSMANEPDTGARRNAFLMLTQCDFSRAIDTTLQAQNESWGDINQLATLGLFREIIRRSPSQRESILGMIVNLVESSSPCVAYEGAGLLISVGTNSSNALQTAIGKYVELLGKQTDINVRMHLLGRIKELLSYYPRIVEVYLLDIMRALRSPSQQVREAVMAIVTSLTSRRSIEQVLETMKKEIIKLNEKNVFEHSTDTTGHRMYLDALVLLCGKFPEKSSPIIPSLISYITGTDLPLICDALVLATELAATTSHTRAVRAALLACLPDVPHSRAARQVVSVVFEFSEDDESLKESLKWVLDLLDPLPVDEDPRDDAFEEADKHGAVTYTTKTVVLEDGTYGVEDVINKSRTKKSLLRKMPFSKDYILCANIATAVTKACTRWYARHAHINDIKDLYLKSVLLVASLLRLLRPMTVRENDTRARLAFCLKTLLALNTPHSELDKSYFEHRPHLERAVVVEKENRRAQAAHKEIRLHGDTKYEVDCNPHIRQLATNHGPVEPESTSETAVDTRNRIQQTIPLTGHMDPMYVEVYVKTEAFDVTANFYVYNKTAATLKHITFDLNTTGDLRIVQHPQVKSLEPGNQAHFISIIRVLSAVKSSIFGYVSYEGKDANDRVHLELLPIQLNILAYVVPRATLTQRGFRSLWSKFEWENKVLINTQHVHFKEYLRHVMRQTKLLAAENLHDFSWDEEEEIDDEKWEKYFEALERNPRYSNIVNEEMRFCSVNLYAESRFGEQYVANVCMDKTIDGRIGGAVRIRCRAQGAALAWGDKFSLTDVAS